MGKKAALGIVLLSVFVDMIGLSIVLPIIPFLALKFNATSQQLGYIYAGFAGAQMIATPVTGRLSDRYGRRPLLLISLAGSFCGFMLQGLANSLGLFVVGRVVGGAFGGSMPIAQAFIADVIPAKERPRYFAMLGSVVTVAFMFGPGIGAGLSQFSLQTPMFVSAGTACIGFTLALFAFKEPARLPPEVPVDETTERTRSLSQTAPPPNEPETKTQQNNQSQPTQQRSRARPQPKIPPALVASYRRFIHMMWVVGLLMMFAFSSYIYFFGIFIFDKFGWGSLQYGFVAMGVSVFCVANQMTTNIYITKRLGKHAACIIGLICEGAGLLVLSLMDGPSTSVRGAPVMVIALFFLGIGYALANPSVTAVLSRYASASSQGSIMGTSQSLQALARTIGPLIWGALYSKGKYLPFVIGGVCSLVAACLNTAVLIQNRRCYQRAIADGSLTATDDQATSKPPTTAGDIEMRAPAQQPSRATPHSSTLKRRAQNKSLSPIVVPNDLLEEIDNANADNDNNNGADVEVARRFRHQIPTNYGDDDDEEVDTQSGRGWWGEDLSRLLWQAGLVDYMPSTADDGAPGQSDTTTTNNNNNNNNNDDAKRVVEALHAEVVHLRSRLAQYRRIEATFGADRIEALSPEMTINNIT